MPGALSKITYPTGGYTTLEYELNKKYSGQNYTGQSTSSKSAVINRPANNVNGLITAGPVYFTITGQQTVSLLISRTAKSPNSDGFTRNAYRDFDLTGNGVTQSGQLGLESENIGKTFYFTLSPGTYSLTTYCDAKENMISGIITYQYNNNIPIEGEDAGGLRIKRISNYPMTGQSVTKEYKYTTPDGFSSGVSRLGAYSEKGFEERHLLGGMGTYSDFFRISNSTIGENYYMGVPHYYTTVVESTTNGIEKFTTRTYFNAYDDNLGIDPIKVIKYKNVLNAAPVPVELTQYVFRVKMIGDIYNGVHPEKTMEADAGPDPLYNYSATGYRVIPSWKYLESTLNVHYEGTDTLSTLTTNGYDMNGSRNLLWSKTVDSRGKQQITRYKYPESYSSNLSSNFITANVLSPVWEQQVWSKSGSDSVMVSAVLKQYNNSNFKVIKVSSLTAPNITSLNSETKDGAGRYNTLISDSRYDARVDYTYDTFGKIVRQQLTGGVPISYQWGYPAVYNYLVPNNNQTYVIAECKNAIETEYYYNGFEADTSATIGLAHMGTKFKTGNYAINWTRPNARNYVVSYFYLNNGIWKLSAPQPYLGNSLALSGGTAYDDIRVYPADAQLTTYSILPGIGISGMTDPRGFTTYYDYDSNGRLSNIKDKDGNILKSLNYHFAGTLLAGYGAGPYSNVPMSINLTRNNCDIYDTGSAVVYNIPAGKYRGATQKEADGYAQADLNINGQAYANSRGFCTYGGPPQ